MCGDEDRAQSEVKEMTSLISKEELKQKIESGTIKVERSHLPGAVDITADRVRELAPSLLPDKAAEIAVYCSGPT